MTASEANANRNASVDLIGWNPDKLMFELRKFTEGPTLFAPVHHEVLPEDVNIDRLEKIVRLTHEEQPADFKTLLGAKGVGPATVRAPLAAGRTDLRRPRKPQRSCRDKRKTPRPYWPAKLGRLQLRPRRQRRHSPSRRSPDIRHEHQRPDRGRAKVTRGGNGQDGRAQTPGHLRALCVAQFKRRPACRPADT
jgi:hypothetical protein